MHLREIFCGSLERSRNDGHVPRNISTVCSVFLMHGGAIHCVITGTHQCSHDLSQGGFEVPCQLYFEGNRNLNHLDQEEVRNHLSLL